MTGNKLYIVALMLIILTGCFSRNERVRKPDKFISREKMEDILFDLHISDGLLNNPTMRNEFNYKDSVQNYMDVIESHGYTKPLFEENLNYYFLRKPEKLELIYDNVLANLSRMEADLMQKRETTTRINRNLWTGKNSFNLPDEGTDNPVEFSIPLTGEGEYILTARILVFKDDQSIDPRTVVWFWKDDGTAAGYRELWETIMHEKSSRSETITLTRELRDTTFTHLRARLLDHSPQSGHWEKHSQVTGIVITYKPFEAVQ